MRLLPTKARGHRRRWSADQCMGRSCRHWPCLLPKGVLQSLACIASKPWHRAMWWQLYLHLRVGQLCFRGPPNLCILTFPSIWCRRQWWHVSGGTRLIYLAVMLTAAHCRYPCMSVKTELALTLAMPITSLVSNADSSRSRTWFETRLASWTCERRTI